MSKKDYPVILGGRNIKIDALTDNKISKAELQYAWNPKNKSVEAEDMLYFTSNNKKYLDFLGIAYRQEGLSLYLQASKYMGCVPFVSPITGIKTGNLIVRGRFGEDISELLSIVGDEVEIEYEPRYDLKQDSAIKPPLYFICQQFIDKYIEARKIHWQKFISQEKIQPFPTSSTIWEKYAYSSVDPRHSLKFPNRINSLSCTHREWNDLTFILDLCLQELKSARTPLRSRTPYIEKINRLEFTYNKRDLRYVEEIKTHMSDPIVIKELKEIGRKVLGASIGVQCAWRLDLAVFFERYVQYLVEDLAKKRGAMIHKNVHYRASGEIPAFGLKYIEPDVIIEKNGIQYVVDAKYKMYMYSLNNKSDILYNEFRDDLHQILSYASFSQSKEKKVIIATPYDSEKEPIKRKFKITNQFNGNSCDVYLIGIPLSKIKIGDVKELLNSIIVFR